VVTKKTTGDVGVDALSGLLLTLAIALLGGWLLMLLLGVLHGSFTEAAPTPGFWPCVAVWALVTYLIRIVAYVERNAQAKPK
jgi:hypothetical protein